MVKIHIEGVKITKILIESIRNLLKGDICTTKGVKSTYKGDKITINKIKFARPGTGIPTNEFRFVNGREVKQNLSAETVLQWDMLSN